MKVLVVSSMWPSTDRPNYGIFVKQLVDELRKKDIAVDVAACTDFRRGKLNALRKYSRLFIEVLKKIGPYDVVQAEFIFPSAGIVYLLRRFSKARRVFVFHGSDLYLYQQIPAGRRIYEKILRNASAVVVPTNSFLQEALRLFPVFEDIYVEVIPRGIAPHFFNASLEQREARQKLGLPPDRTIVVSTGNLIPLKNFAVLVEAAALLKNYNIEVVIIGEGPDRPHLVELAGRKGVDVVLPGAVPNEKLPVWYAAADIYVAPSTRESLGIALREAMASGLPVVASGIPAHLEAVSDSCGLVFDPENSEELAEKIAVLIDNDDLRQSLARNARQKMRDNLLGETARRYVELYEKLVSGGIGD